MTKAPPEGLRLVPGRAIVRGDEYTRGKASTGGRHFTRTQASPPLACNGAIDSGDDGSLDRPGPCTAPPVASKKDRPGSAWARPEGGWKVNDERERIKKAIRQWWPSSGGTARRIVDVLEREGASEKEARFVGAKLAAAASRLSVITETIIEQELEMAQAAGSAGSVPVNKGWDGARCVFNDEPCPECAEWDGGVDNDGNPYPPVVHGRLLSPEEMSAGIKEIQELLATKWPKDA